MNKNDRQQRKTPIIKIARIFNFPNKKLTWENSTTGQKCLKRVISIRKKNFQFEVFRSMKLENEVN